MEGNAFTCKITSKIMNVLFPLVYFFPQLFSMDTKFHHQKIITVNLKKLDKYKKGWRPSSTQLYLKESYSPSFCSSGFNPLM